MASEKAKVVSLDNRKLVEETKDIEVGALLKHMQRHYKLPNEVAQCCSLYSIVEVSSKSNVCTQKNFIDQRDISRKLNHQSIYQGGQQLYYYGVKFYPVNILGEEWMIGAARVLFIHQICHDLEKGFISLDYSSDDDLKLLLKLIIEASGQNLAKDIIFQKNTRCKDLIESVKSNADVQLPEHGKIEALVKLSKLVFMLHGYGKHPFLASRHVQKAQYDDVVITSDYNGVSIANCSGHDSPLIVSWDDIVKFSYKESRIKLKYLDNEKKRKLVFNTSFQKDQAKLIWKSMIDFHGFQRLLKFEDHSLPKMTLFQRKSNFRHFRITEDSCQMNGKYTLGNAERCLWGFTEVPTYSTTLSELKVDILLSYLPKSYEYFYDISQDSTTRHNIREIEGKAHVCVQSVPPNED